MKKNYKSTLILLGFSLMIFFNANAQSLSAYGKQGEVVQTLVDNLSNARYEDVRKDFAIIYKNSLPREVIAQNWEAVQSLIGGFKSISSATKGKDFNGNDIIRVRCACAKENVWVDVTFNPDLKVVFLSFRP